VIGAVSVLVIAVVVACDSPGTPPSVETIAEPTPVATPSPAVGRYELFNSSDGRTLWLDSVTGLVGVVGEEGLTRIPVDASMIGPSPTRWDDIKGLPSDVKSVLLVTRWFDGKLQYRVDLEPGLEREWRRFQGEYRAVENGKPVSAYCFTGKDKFGFRLVAFYLEPGQSPGLFFETVGEPKKVWIRGGTGEVPCALATYIDVSEWEFEPIVDHILLATNR